MSDERNTVEITTTSAQLTKAIELLSRHDSVEHTSEEAPVPLHHAASEFLLYLWWLAEKDDSTIELEKSEIGYDRAEIWLEDRMVFGAPDTHKKLVVCRSDEQRAPEAIAAIQSGKRLVELRLGMRLEDMEFQFTLVGTELLLHGLKLPKVISDREDGLESLIELRMGLIEILDSVLARLFQAFASERIDGDLHATLHRFFYPAEEDES